MTRLVEYWVTTTGFFPVVLSQHRTPRQAEREARRIERTDPRWPECQVVKAVLMPRAPRRGRP